MEQYKELIKLHKQISNDIKQTNYDIKYLYYLIQQQLTTHQKNQLLLKTNGMIKIIKNTYIFGEHIYKLINNENITEIILHIYFYSQENINELINFFNDYIIENNNNKILILYQNIQLILHTKKIYNNQLELILNKTSHKYNCCLLKNIFYYSPITYYLLKYNINPFIGNIHNIKLYNSIINEIDNLENKIDKTKPLNNQINNIMNILKEKFKNSLDILYIILLILKKKIYYFNIFINYLPLDFFINNYVIFELIKRGDETFFTTLNNYEQKNNKSFDFNVLNQDGLTPPEYCIYRLYELLNNSNTPIKYKEAINIRYKQILNILLYKRNIKYTRLIVFFDAIMQTNLIKQQEEYKIFYDEIKEFIKHKTNQLAILNSNNIYSIKHLNTLYLTICYIYLNTMEKPIINFDDIVNFIIFNKNFIDINSILLLCEANNSQLVLTTLLQKEIITLRNFNVVKILLNLKYYKLFEKYKYQIDKPIINNIQNNNQSTNNYIIKDTLIYLIDTFNIDGLLYINEHYFNSFNLRLNNNNTLLHYISSLDITDDNLLCKQIGIIKEIFNTFYPDMINTVNNDNETPIFLCKKPEIFKILLELNPNLNILNKNGLSIIHKLISENNIELLTILIENNINSLLIKDINNNIPIIYCFKNKLFNYILFLLNIKFNYSDDIKKLIQEYLDIYNFDKKYYSLNSEEFKKYYILNNISAQIKK